MNKPFLLIELTNLVLLALVITLIRRKNILNFQAVKWVAFPLFLFAAVALAYSSAFRNFEELLGLKTPVTLVYFGSIYLLITISLSLAVTITKMQEQIKSLAQHVSLLEDSSSSR